MVYSQSKLRNWIDPLKLDSRRLSFNYNAIDYINKIDRVVPGIDVVDDYRSEHKEVIRYNGKNFKFSFGDYVVKSLLGPIDPYFDNLDERNQNSCCCIS